MSESAFSHVAAETITWDKQPWGFLQTRLTGYTVDAHIDLNHRFSPENRVWHFVQIVIRMKGLILFSRKNMKLVLLSSV